jgi:two-component system NtrC family sensor kinase
MPFTELDPEQLAALSDALPTPVFAIAPESGRVLAANRAFGELVGIAPAEVLGTEPVYPWTEADFRGAGGSVETSFRHAAGRVVAVEVECVQAVDDRGTPFAVVCAVTDLTRKRRLEQQLVQSGKLAAIGELAAGVAHEVNNPLFAILGLTEFLAKDAEPGSKAAERLTLIRESGEEIRDIVRALLDFARENAAERQIVPLAHVVRQAVTLLRRTNAHKGVELVTAYEDDDALVRVSPNQVKQILLNLITNARQAMPGGGTVSIETRRRGDRALVVVSDDGPGVPPDIADRIFEPFFTTKGLPEGTGLGLSVSLGLAEANGGSLTLDTDRQRGAAFKLSLPLVEDEEDE